MSALRYRYGFNGKEWDDEGEWGDLTHYDYGFRIYNPGIGRFLSVDLLSVQYPELTPYQFASNMPIAAIDLDGLESKLVIHPVADAEDGGLQILDTHVEINHDVELFDESTHKRYAETQVQYIYEDGTYALGDEFYIEEIVDGGPRPSAAYDNTLDVNPEKQAEDIDYIRGGKWYQIPSRWKETFDRDKAAPDNARLMQNLQVLDVALRRADIPDIDGKDQSIDETLGAKKRKEEFRDTKHSTNSRAGGDKSRFCDQYFLWVGGRAKYLLQNPKGMTFTYLWVGWISCWRGHRPASKQK